MITLIGSLTFRHVVSADQGFIGIQLSAYADDPLSPPAATLTGETMIPMGYYPDDLGAIYEWLISAGLAVDNPFSPIQWVEIEALVTRFYDSLAFTCFRIQFRQA
jgi:hypothetical protein